MRMDEFTVCDVLFAVIANICHHMSDFDISSFKLATVVTRASQRHSHWTRRSAGAARGSLRYCQRWYPHFRRGSTWLSSSHVRRYVYCLSYLLRLKLSLIWMISPCYNRKSCSITIKYCSGHHFFLSSYQLLIFCSMFRITSSATSTDTMHNQSKGLRQQVSVVCLIWRELCLLLALLRGRPWYFYLKTSTHEEGTWSTTQRPTAATFLSWVLL